MRKLGTIALMSLVLVAAGCDVKYSGSVPAPAPAPAAAAPAPVEEAPVDTAAAQPEKPAEKAAPEPKAAPAEEPKKEPVAKEIEKPVENPAPDFTLPDPDGKEHALSAYKGKWVVLEWINHGCPFVKKHYSKGDMQRLQKRYRAKGVAWLSVCSSAPGKQGYFDGDGWKAALEEHDSYPTALLMDPAGKVGKLYGATATPEMVVIDPRGGIVYHGAIDSIRSTKPADVAKATNYVAEVLDAVLAGEPSPHTKTKSYGCSVKYAKKDDPAR